MQIITRVCLGRSSKLTPGSWLVLSCCSGKHRPWQALGFVAEFQSFVEVQDEHPSPQSGAQHFMTRVCTLVEWDCLRSWLDVRSLQAVQRSTRRSK